MTLPEEAHDRLRCYRNALSNWNYAGYIDAKPRVSEWFKKNFPNQTVGDIYELMYEFAANGGWIDEQVERCPEYVSFEFHYDLRVKIENRTIYLETVLLCDNPNDPDDPRIVIVSSHDA